MQSMTQYTDTCLEVGQEMQVQAQAAMDAGIEPWRIILDPGAYCLLQPFQFMLYLQLHNTHQLYQTWGQSLTQDAMGAIHIGPCSVASPCSGSTTGMNLQVVVTLCISCSQSLHALHF